MELVGVTSPSSSSAQPLRNDFFLIFPPQLLSSHQYTLRCLKVSTCPIWVEAILDGLLLMMAQICLLLQKLANDLEACEPTRD